MDIITYTYPVPFCLIKNFCCSEKLQQIKNELDTLRPFLLSASDTNPAKNAGGDLAVKRKGIFLHEHSYLKGNSGINSILDTVISKPIVDHLVKKNWVFSYLTNTPRLGTLISLYEDGDTVIAELLISIDGKERILVTDILQFTDEGKIVGVRAYKG